MIPVHRILRKPYAKEPLNGEGAFRFGGRWSSIGTRIVYTAEHMSLAMIDKPPRDLVVVTAEVPDSVSPIAITTAELPPKWRQTPAPPELAEIGDQFVRDANWLINPRHREFPRIHIRPAERL